MTLWLRVGVGIGRGPGSSPAGDKEWKKKKKAIKKRKFFFYIWDGSLPMLDFVDRLDSIRVLLL